MNYKLKKSQVLVVSLLTILVIISPLLSSSLRPTYLYFITNLLIIALGAEAGLLSFFANPNSLDHNHSVDHKKLISNPNNNNTSLVITPNQKLINSSSDDQEVKEERVKKCPSMPSLFFIGGGDNEVDLDQDYHDDDDNDDDDDDCDEQEKVGEISGQELFAKAENFIGNFYKQLKMQREESWKRIHGFYQRAF